MQGTKSEHLGGQVLMEAKESFNFVIHAFDLAKSNCLTGTGLMGQYQNAD